MPTYSYTCLNCRETFDVDRPIAQYQQPANCMTCGASCGRDMVAELASGVAWIAADEFDPFALSEEQCYRSPRHPKGRKASDIDRNYAKVAQRKRETMRPTKNIRLAHSIPVEHYYALRRIDRHFFEDKRNVEKLKAWEVHK